MAVLPEDIPTGKVTGQFYFVNEDTIEDPDQYPQLIGSQSAGMLMAQSLGAQMKL